MMPAKVMSGRYGMLTIIGRADGPNRHGAYWLCRCDCGKETVAWGGNIRNGTTRSCGDTKHKVKHGAVGTKTYTSWYAAKTRCTNPNQLGWKNYGGRGITMCGRWLNSYEAFLADMGERPPGHSLDRIDSNGNYEPGNCRWADRKTQNRNSRRAVLTAEMRETIDRLVGQMSQSAIASLLGITATIVSRYVRGVSWQS